jgi:hypothetical protein
MPFAKCDIGNTTSRPQDTLSGVECRIPNYVLVRCTGTKNTGPLSREKWTHENERGIVFANGLAGLRQIPKIHLWAGQFNYIKINRSLYVDRRLSTDILVWKNNFDRLPYDGSFVEIGRNRRDPCAIGIDNTGIKEPKTAEANKSRYTGKPIQYFRDPYLPIPVSLFISAMLFIGGGWLSGFGFVRGITVAHIGGWLIMVVGGFLLVVLGIPLLPQLK